jgi:hypothetical protein
MRGGLTKPFGVGLGMRGNLKGICPEVISALSSKRGLVRIVMSDVPDV